MLGFNKQPIRSDKMQKNNQKMTEYGLKLLQIAEEDLSQQGIELEEIEPQGTEFLDFCNSDAIKFTFTATECDYDDFGELKIVPITNKEEFEIKIGKTIQLANAYYIKQFSWVFVESESNKFTCWLTF